VREIVMTIVEFHTRLVSTDEGSGLLSGLRKLCRIEDPRALVASLSELLMWILWRIDEDSPAS
jgi:hypothetical protein